jgi:GTPase Era involved in 16S rRNA processing
MSFFDSEVVRAELTEIQELQEKVYTDVFTFSAMSDDEKSKHIDFLEDLLDKQRIMYTRLSLSDDPEALQMKQQILESARLMGLPSTVSMDVIFSNMQKIIVTMRNQI